MARSSILPIILCFLIASPVLTAQAAGEASAQNRKISQSPVVVTVLKRGVLAPERLFIGTVYFAEISRVTAEVSGVVEEFHGREGQRISRGKPLATLDASLNGKELQAKRALHEQALTELEKARKDLARLIVLFQKNIIPEKSFDEAKFLAESLEKKAKALEAEVEHLTIIVGKSVITAPFDGIVITKDVAPGEWLAPGISVASLARTDSYEVLVNIPEEVLPFVRTGLSLNVAAGGGVFKGTVAAVIPKGDVATRTFPVKILIAGPAPLAEGMKAQIAVPVGKKRTVLFIPRDAVVTASGSPALVAVVDGKAKFFPVSIAGYDNLQAAVVSDALTAGMKIVVKGQERLRPEQPVTIAKELP
ncbi:MAG: efflux RND transporter periplasmic adaptor subunit [Deltaproteobacteria bacterium]|nr:efflux RND transporter periplasmic adaptor subunit [Deltaproteobacteria bacterium]